LLAPARMSSTAASSPKASSITITGRLADCSRTSLTADSLHQGVARIRSGHRALRLSPAGFQRVIGGQTCTAAIGEPAGDRDRRGFGRRGRRRTHPGRSQQLRAEEPADAAGARRAAGDGGVESRQSRPPGERSAEARRRKASDADEFHRSHVLGGKCRRPRRWGHTRLEAIHRADLRSSAWQRLVGRGASRRPQDGQGCLA
jgi:hypothetical protein